MYAVYPSEDIIRCEIIVEERMMDTGVSVLSVWATQGWLSYSTTP